MIRASIRLGTRAWCSLECAANELSTINLAAISGKTASNREEAQMGRYGILFSFSHFLMLTILDRIARCSFNRQLQRK